MSGATAGAGPAGPAGSAGSAEPAATFAEVAARHPRCFWLDGGGARAWSGRRSLIGWLDDDDVSLSYDAERREVTRHRAGRSRVVGDDVFAVLEAELAVGSPADQWFGYLGYAARPDLTARSGALPDAVWMRARHVRLFDHPEPPEPPEPPSRRSRVGRVGCPPPGPDRVAGTRRLRPRARRCQRSTPPRSAGCRSTSMRATPTRSTSPTAWSRAATSTPCAAYLRLRDLNPAPYAGFLQHDVDGARSWLLSSSPERYALVTADRTLETKPIKGTTPRGGDPARDEELRTLLATDRKYRAENLMIVDLLRNDLSMVCEPGSVEVPVLMEVESYATVHQLVSTVRGRLRDDVSTVGALRALFPAGSMTGAPKLRTMQVIEEVEATPRGVYAGAFGWVSGDGRADLGVVIRSLTTAGDGHWEIGTGGGITVLSDVAEEYAEASVKAERLLRVFDRP